MCGLMTDHEHEWEVLKHEQSEPEWYIWCPKCGDRMDTIEEINAMLNEHAALKREASDFYGGPIPGFIRVEITRKEAIAAYRRAFEYQIKEIAKLKRATDALSVLDARYVADELETRFRMADAPNALRAYADALEESG